MNSAIRSLIVAVGIGFWAGNSECGAQGTAEPPSARLGRLCEELRRASSDARDVSSSLRGADVELSTNVADQALQSARMCNSVVDLLRICEMLSPGRERDDVVWYVRERLSRHAPGIAADVRYMNGLSALTRVPGIALATERIRDKIRVMGDLFVELAPK
jgi:hypothetical protein